MLFYKGLQEYIAEEERKLQILKESSVPERGVITKVLLSDKTKTRESHLKHYSLTHEVETLTIDTRGIEGDRHYGHYTYSGGREKVLYKKGTPIAQSRHLFAVSLHDCHVLSEKMGVEITPELLGANLVIECTDKKEYSLSLLPHRTYLCIDVINADKPSRSPVATLIHHVQQQGCGVTGAGIAEFYKDPSLTAKFVQNSKTHRGIVCRVEYPVAPAARITKGQSVFFRFPQGISP